ncbi:MAG: hypothetical protein JETT_0821 [Candidatus Jettenia ecosi]|uniref:Uncharacterized protein n=1 Tax=Candidatus Jettenia ecosi TaxID=2494326 RepID=A0A533QJK2_9BACT|nr:MAG: hypothetical protein JETT_0821 [Candidatus Jettenia ecosi]
MVWERNCLETLFRVGTGLKPASPEESYTLSFRFITVEQAKCLFYH